MSHNKAFYTLFSNLNNNIQINNNIFKQKKSKKTLQILNILINEGFVQGYRFSKQNKYYIYIYTYSRQQNFFNIKYISKPSLFLYISNKNLLTKKGFYLISTTIGLFTNYELKKINLGGKLICQII